MRLEYEMELPRMFEEGEFGAGEVLLLVLRMVMP